MASLGDQPDDNEPFKSDVQLSVKKEKKPNKEKAEFDKSVTDFIPLEEPVEKSSEGKLFKTETEVPAFPTAVTAVIKKPKAGRKLEPEIFEVETVTLIPVKPSSVREDVTEAEKENTISLASNSDQPDDKVEVQTFFCDIAPNQKEPDQESPAKDFFKSQPHFPAVPAEISSVIKNDKSPSDTPSNKSKRKFKKTRDYIRESTPTADFLDSPELEEVELEEVMKITAQQAQVQLSHLQTNEATIIQESILLESDHPMNSSFTKGVPAPIIARTQKQPLKEETIVTEQFAEWNAETIPDFDTPQMVKANLSSSQLQQAVNIFEPIGHEQPEWTSQPVGPSEKAKIGLVLREAILVDQVSMEGGAQERLAVKLPNSSSIEPRLHLHESLQCQEVQSSPSLTPADNKLPQSASASVDLISAFPLTVGQVQSFNKPEKYLPEFFVATEKARSGVTSNECAVLTVETSAPESEGVYTAGRLPPSQQANIALTFVQEAASVVQHNLHDKETVLQDFTEFSQITEMAQVDLVGGSTMLPIVCQPQVQLTAEEIQSEKSVSKTGRFLIQPHESIVRHEPTLADCEELGIKSSQPSTMVENLEPTMVTSKSITIQTHELEDAQPKDADLVVIPTRIQATTNREGIKKSDVACCSSYQMTLTEESGHVEPTTMPAQQLATSGHASLLESASTIEKIPYEMQGVVLATGHPAPLNLPEAVVEASLPCAQTDWAELVDKESGLTLPLLPESSQATARLDRSFWSAAGVGQVELLQAGDALVQDAQQPEKPKIGFIADSGQSLRPTVGQVYLEESAAQFQPKLGQNQQNATPVLDEEWTTTAALTNETWTQERAAETEVQLIASVVSDFAQVSLEKPHQSVSQLSIVTSLTTQPKHQDQNPKSSQATSTVVPVQQGVAPVAEEVQLQESQDPFSLLPPLNAKVNASLSVPVLESSITQEILAGYKEEVLNRFQMPEQQKASFNLSVTSSSQALLPVTAEVSKVESLGSCSPDAKSASATQLMSIRPVQDVQQSVRVVTVETAERESAFVSDTLPHANTIHTLQQHQPSSSCAAVTSEVTPELMPASAGVDTQNTHNVPCKAAVLPPPTMQPLDLTETSVNESLGQLQPCEHPTESRATLEVTERRSIVVSQPQAVEQGSDRLDEVVLPQSQQVRVEMTVREAVAITDEQQPVQHGSEYQGLFKPAAISVPASMVTSLEGRAAQVTQVQTGSSIGQLNSTAVPSAETASISLPIMMETATVTKINDYSKEGEFAPDSAHPASKTAQAISGSELKSIQVEENRVVESEGHLKAMVTGSLLAESTSSVSQLFESPSTYAAQVLQKEQPLAEFQSELQNQSARPVPPSDHKTAVQVSQVETGICEGVLEKEKQATEQRANASHLPEKEVAVRKGEEVLMDFISPRRDQKTATETAVPSFTEQRAVSVGQVIEATSEADWTAGMKPEGKLALHILPEQVQTQVASVQPAYKEGQMEDFVIGLQQTVKPVPVEEQRTVVQVSTVEPNMMETPLDVKPVSSGQFARPSHNIQEVAVSQEVTLMDYTTPKTTEPSVQQERSSVAMTEHKAISVGQIVLDERSFDGELVAPEKKRKSIKATRVLPECMEMTISDVQTSFKEAPMEEFKPESGRAARPNAEEQKTVQVTQVQSELKEEPLQIQQPVGKMAIINRSEKEAAIVSQDVLMDFTLPQTVKPIEEETPTVTVTEQKAVSIGEVLTTQTETDLVPEVKKKSKKATKVLPEKIETTVSDVQLAFKESPLAEFDLGQTQTARAVTDNEQKTVQVTQVLTEMREASFDAAALPTAQKVKIELPENVAAIKTETVLLDASSQEESKVVVPSSETASVVLPKNRVPTVKSNEVQEAREVEIDQQPKPSKQKAKTAIREEKETAVQRQDILMDFTTPQAAQSTIEKENSIFSIGEQRAVTVSEVVPALSEMQMVPEAKKKSKKASKVLPERTETSVSDVQVAFKEAPIEEFKPEICQTGRPIVDEQRTVLITETKSEIKEEPLKIDQPSSKTAKTSQSQNEVAVVSQDVLMDFTVHQVIAAVETESPIVSITEQKSVSISEVVPASSETQMVPEAKKKGKKATKILPEKTETSVSQVEASFKEAPMEEFKPEVGQTLLPKLNEQRTVQITQVTSELKEEPLEVEQPIKKTAKSIRSQMEAAVVSEDVLMDYTIPQAVRAVESEKPEVTVTEQKAMSVNEIMPSQAEVELVPEVSKRSKKATKVLQEVMQMNVSDVQVAFKESPLEDFKPEASQTGERIMDELRTVEIRETKSEIKEEPLKIEQPIKKTAKTRRPEKEAAQVTQDVAMDFTTPHLPSAPVESETPMVIMTEQKAVTISEVVPTSSEKELEQPIKKKSKKATKILPEKKETSISDVQLADREAPMDEFKPEAAQATQSTMEKKKPVNITEVQSSIKEELLEIPQPVSKTATTSQGDAEATATVCQDVLMENTSPHSIKGVEAEMPNVILAEQKAVNVSQVIATSSEEQLAPVVTKKSKKASKVLPEKIETEVTDVQVAFRESPMEDFKTETSCAIRPELDEKKTITVTEVRAEMKEESLEVQIPVMKMATSKQPQVEATQISQTILMDSSAPQTASPVQMETPIVTLIEQKAVSVGEIIPTSTETELIPTIKKKTKKANKILTEKTETAVSQVEATIRETPMSDFEAIPIETARTVVTEANEQGTLQVSQVVSSIDSSLPQSEERTAAVNVTEQAAVTIQEISGPEESVKVVAPVPKRKAKKATLLTPSEEEVVEQQKQPTVVQPAFPDTVAVTLEVPVVEEETSVSDDSFHSPARRSSSSTVIDDTMMTAASSLEDLVVDQQPLPEIIEEGVSQVIEEKAHLVEKEIEKPDEVSVIKKLKKKKKASALINEEEIQESITIQSAQREETDANEPISITLAELAPKPCEDVEIELKIPSKSKDDEVDEEIIVQLTTNKPQEPIEDVEAQVTLKPKRKTKTNKLVEETGDESVTLHQPKKEEKVELGLVEKEPETDATITLEEKVPEDVEGEFKIELSKAPSAPTEVEEQLTLTKPKRKPKTKKRVQGEDGSLQSVQPKEETESLVEFELARQQPVDEPVTASIQINKPQETIIEPIDDVKEQFQIDVKLPESKPEELDEQFTLKQKRKPKTKKPAAEETAEPVTVTLQPQAQVIESQKIEDVVENQATLQFKSKDVQEVSQDVKEEFKIEIPSEKIKQQEDVEQQITLKPKRKPKTKKIEDEAEVTTIILQSTPLSDNEVESSVTLKKKAVDESTDTERIIENVDQSFAVELKKEENKIDEVEQQLTLKPKRKPKTAKVEEAESVTVTIQPVEPLPVEQVENSVTLKTTEPTEEVTQEFAIGFKRESKPEEQVEEQLTLKPKRKPKTKKVEDETAELVTVTIKPVEQQPTESVESSVTIKQNEATFEEQIIEDVDQSFAVELKKEEKKIEEVEQQLTLKPKRKPKTKKVEEETAEPVTVTLQPVDTPLPVERVESSVTLKTTDVSEDKKVVEDVTQEFAIGLKKESKLEEQVEEQLTLKPKRKPKAKKVEEETAEPVTVTIQPVEQTRVESSVTLKTTEQTEDQQSIEDVDQSFAVELKKEETKIEEVEQQLTLKPKRKPKTKKVEEETAEPITVTLQKPNMVQEVEDDVELKVNRSDQPTEATIQLDKTKETQVEHVEDVEEHFQFGLKTKELKKETKTEEVEEQLTLKPKRKPKAKSLVEETAEPVTVTIQPQPEETVKEVGSAATFKLKEEIVKEEEPQDVEEQFQIGLKKPARQPQAKSEDVEEQLTLKTKKKTKVKKTVADETAEPITVIVQQQQEEKEEQEDEVVSVTTVKRKVSRPYRVEETEDEVQLIGAPKQEPKEPTSVEGGATIKLKPKKVVVEAVEDVEEHFQIGLEPKRKISVPTPTQDVDAGEFSIKQKRKVSKVEPVTEEASEATTLVLRAEPSSTKTKEEEADSSVTSDSGVVSITDSSVQQQKKSTTVTKKKSSMKRKESEDALAVEARKTRESLEGDDVDESVISSSRDTVPIQPSTGLFSRVMPSNKPLSTATTSVLSEEESSEVTSPVPDLIREGDELFSLCMYVPTEDDENAMSLAEGERVYVLEWHNSDWWFVRKHLTNEVGWVPAQFLRDEVNYTHFVKRKLDEKIAKLPVFDLPSLSGSASVPAAPQAPHFTTKLPSVVKAPDGTSATFTCQVQGIPTPVITWFRQTAVIKPSQEFRTDYDETDGGRATLTVVEVWPEDAGMFTCVAKNSAGFASSSTQLVVEPPLADDHASGSGRSISRESSLADILEGIPPTFSQRPRTKIVDEGTDVELECRLVAVPEPEVIWFHNGKRLKTDDRIELLGQTDVHLYCSIIRISDVRMSDAGTYDVVARNREGEAVSHVVLTVKVRGAKKSPPVVQQPLKNTSVQLGADVVLTAKVSGSPRPTVKWYRNGVQIQVSDDGRVSIAQEQEPEETGRYTLKIRGVKSSDDGDYLLSAENEHGQAQTSATLTVQPLLSFLETFSDQSVVEGEPLTLKAVVVCHDTGAQLEVAWYRNSKRLKATSSLKLESTVATGSEPTVHTLHVTKAGPEKEAGEYKCVVVSGPHKISHSARVTVDNSNAFEVELKDVEVDADAQQVILRCRTKRPVTERVTWCRDGVELEDEGGRGGEEDGGQLDGVIRRTSEDGRDHEVTLLRRRPSPTSGVGRYSCSFSNQTTACLLTVRSGKKKSGQFVAKLQDVEVKERQEATFTVEVSSDKDKVTWHKDGQVLLETDVRFQIVAEGVRRQLVIRSASLQDEGEYTCALGDKECTAELVVIELPPEITLQLKDVTVKRGEQASFETELTKGDAKIRWFRGEPAREIQFSEHLQLAIDGKRQRLMVFDCGPDDEQIYSCVIGEQKSTAKLTVLVPEVDFTARLPEATAGTMGQDVTFTIHLSKEDSQVPVTWMKNGEIVVESDRIKCKSKFTFLSFFAFICCK